MLVSEKVRPRIGIITLIQEGAVRIGGEHAMLFPYVEQAIKAAKTVEEQVEIVPIVISPRPKKLKSLSRVEELKKQMKLTNEGQMILVSNGGAGPYGEPWHWERFGHEANKAIIKLVKDRQLDSLIIMVHGFASIPVILNLSASSKRDLLKDISLECYAITHSTFDEHRDDRPQRRLLEREISAHAKMIAISPYMANHLEQIKIVEDKTETIPLYNALPERGWFSNKVQKSIIVSMINERNKRINQGPFYGVELPLQEILNGGKELVLYFGRAQKYVKGTDAVIASARKDKKRHYMIICKGSNEELKWHKKMINELNNVTLAWEHNSQLVLGVVQLTENSKKTRIIALFLSRREPMGLVNRELLLMQNGGSVLPIVSDNCGFEDEWQKKYSFVVTNPKTGEDEESQQQSFTKLAKEDELYISQTCIEETISTLDEISNMSITELRKRVNCYAKDVKKHYSQDRYWAFYLQALAKLMPDYQSFIEEKMLQNGLEKIPNV